jgi:signal transduction histidine kinase
LKEAVHRASNIINILLDYARPRRLQRVPTNLNTLVEDSLTLVRQQLNKGHVTVRCELQERLPAVLLDGARIEHVLVNLLSNAQQAMPDGGMLTIRTAVSGPVQNGTGGPGFVTVEIEDTGDGIASEHLEKVFEPFFTTKPAGQGTGLGLSIARKIMEIHGGSISLHNRKEGGARAVLQFNLNEKGTL